MYERICYISTVLEICPKIVQYRTVCLGHRDHVIDVDYLMYGTVESVRYRRLFIDLFYVVEPLDTLIFAFYIVVNFIYDLSSCY